MAHEYPKKQSLVEVVYIDGEVKQFTMTAGSGIVHHLMQEAAKTGALVMRDDVAQRSICIPMSQVRYVDIQTMNGEGQKDDSDSR